MGKKIFGVMEFETPEEFFTTRRIVEKFLLDLKKKSSKKKPIGNLDIDLKVVKGLAKTIGLYSGYYDFIK